MKILVMGAGAVGAYFGARLQQAGEQVVLCARGDNLRALREHGLAVKSYKGDFAVRVEATDDPRDDGPYELILFCVKSYDTERAARTIDGCLNAGGAILTVQNGVENEVRLCELFGADAVMAGNARIGAEMIAPGQLVHRTGGFIEFGELDGRDTARARKLAEIFQRAGIFGELTMRLGAIRWEKLLWNAAFNSVTALSGRKVGDVLDDAEGEALLRALMTEIVAVAQAEGVPLSEAQVEAQIARSRANLREVRPSTLQDSERGKPLEFEALSGAVVRAVRRHGLAAPYMAAIHALMKLLDENRK
jgi:2-dehydropantoate 2-reductase